MRLRRVAPIICIFTLVVSSAAQRMSGSQEAEGAAAAATLAGWRSLTLCASKPPLYEASATFKVAEATHAASGRPAVQFSTQSQATMLGVIGFNEETTSWIDAQKHGALEFFQLRPGESARRYLFQNGSIKQTSYGPPAENPGAPFDAWKEKETTERRFTFAEGGEAADGEPVVDAYSLIYLLRDIDLTEPRPAPKEFIVLHRRNLVRLRLTAEDQRTGERQVLDEKSGVQVTLKLTERRLKLQPQGEAAKSFRGLMGMQGETEIWVDQDSRALLEINGQASGFGATQVALTSFSK